MAFLPKSNFRSFFLYFGIYAKVVFIYVFTHKNFIIDNLIVIISLSYTYKNNNVKACFSTKFDNYDKIMIRLLSMNVFSYNLSSILKENLLKIDLLNKQIILAEISPKDEIRFRWETVIERIYWVFQVNGINIEKEKIIKFLSSEKKNTNEFRLQVTNFKKAIDYINLDWILNKKFVSVKTVAMLHDKLCTGGSLNKEKELRQALEYLQSGTEHPIIRSAISFIQIVDLSCLAKGNMLLSSLLSLLFLYKYGYYFRGFLTLEEYWKKEYEVFNDVTRKVIKSKNATLWLEFYSKGIIWSLENKLKDISSTKFLTDLSGTFWELSDRQKEIISELDRPGATITNRKVQSMLKVSQITASRDLTKLANIGLLFPHGKGRSIYYTKV